MSTIPCPLCHENPCVKPLAKAMFPTTWPSAFTATAWLKVPPTMKFTFRGEIPPYLTAKDLILAVIGEIGVGGGTNAALESVGEGAEALSIDERLAVSNMAVEAGAETGFFPADEKVTAYLDGRTDRPWTAERSDPDAELARRLEIDLGGLPPLIALPHLPGNVVPVEEVVGKKIDQVYIGNCSNGTMTDLRQTAEVLRGHTVHPDCRMIVVPATQSIYREAMREGLLDLFVEAGAIVSTPTCGACFGGHMGVLGPGERAITTTNRNFKGRMGSGEAEVHLANAYVAAAAAVAGEIVDPAEILAEAPA